MFVVGLTGLMGSGKSTVAKFLGEFGAHVIDVDKLGHVALETKRDKIVEQFGKEILTDNKIDRSKLGQLVFQNPQKLKELESITHPVMVGLVKQDIATTSDAEYCVIDAAILYEMELDKLADLNVVVTSQDEDLIQRVKIRTGLSEQQIKQRLETQKSRVDKFKSADYFLPNNGGVEELKEQSYRLHQWIWDKAFESGRA